MAYNDPTDAVVAKARELVAFAIRDGFQNASVAAIRSTTSPLFTGMLTAIRRDVGTRKDMAKVNADLAYGMRTAVLKDYQLRVVRRKQYPSYRIGQNRFSGGALLRALGKPAMFRSDAFGVSFGDRDLLDREAAHWHRLNFGAGPRALSLHRGRAVRVKFGRQLGTIRINDEPSPGFAMPFGIWEKGRSGRPAGFYPLRRELVMPTEGIAGRRFLDAGARSFGRDFPTAYENLLETYVARAVNEGRGPLTRGNVPVQIALDLQLKFGPQA